MGDVNHEPTMEDILASIKKIIAEDGGDRPRPRHDAAPPAPAQAEQARPVEDVLELTQTVAPESEMRTDAPPEIAGAGDPDALLSEAAAGSSRAALAMLSSIAAASTGAGEAAGSQAIEQLVREMLRPLLKQWLDDNLPTLVETLVAREIARIAGANS